MIGRERELARLRELLGSVATSGAGEVVVVEGEAGIGKTTLVAVLTDAAAAAGFQTLRCSGFQRGALAGFAALHELVHPVLDRVFALPPRQRAALLTALGLQEGPAPDRLLIALAVLGLVEEVAATRPLLLVVEDAQWLDVSSAEVIGFVARRLGVARALLLASARTDRGEASSPESGSEVLESAATVRVLLQPLSRHHSEELLDAVEAAVARAPGAAAPSPLTAEARRRVLDEAGGNPLALRELTAALRARDTGQRLPATAPLPTTRRLEAAFLGEVADLPAASRTLLLLAAAGEGERLSELLDAGQRLGVLIQDLTPLERADLVSVVRDRLRLRHPLLRSAVYGAVSSLERAEAHRALAATTGDSGRAAWHRAAATVAPDESVAAELETAAAQAAGRGARAEAATALHRAAELSPVVDERVRLLVQAAELARQAGNLAQADQVLAEAAALPMSPRRRFEWAQSRALVSTYLGREHSSTADQLAYAQALGGASGAEHPEQRAAVLVAAAFHASNHVNSDTSSEVALRRAVHDQLAAIDLGRRDAAQQLGLAVLDPLAHAGLVRPTLPAMLSRAPGDSLLSLLTLAQAAELLQDLPTARRARALAAEELQRLGSPSDVVHALSGLALLEVIAGQLPDALQHAEQARRTALDLGLPLVAALAGASTVQVYLWTGRRPEAATVLQSSRALLAGAGVERVPAGLAWASGLLAMDQRRYSDALTDLHGTSRHPVFEQWAIADLTEAAVRSGEPEVAHPVLARVGRAAEVLGSAHLSALVHRSRALLADGHEAEEHYRASLAAGETGGVLLEQARTQLIYGEWLRRARRVLEAREQLSAALRTFEAAGVGAGSLAQRAGAELRAAGSVPATRPAPERPLASLTSMLTAQELQIVRLAAQGLTNKEIADRVYLSHRTVGSHLYRVFPKLGVANRHQLREILERTDLALPNR
ncbi:helix-turn-helix transcriptional regulator [Kineococcus radiotolerans]|uniref:helix-turn-helix transcriptional regulator n=1 Tax=Kineococcus radiotolerans TaxID=131568 RepID=UPI00003A3C63|nr:AAA family ATPase [Kineococcus radiotolerans]